MVSWVLLITAMTAYHLRQDWETAERLAEVEALATYNKDLVYRRWSAMHGGAYVQVSENTPPNPYLTHVQERDITTPTGRQLTLVNPAYMTRQVHDLAQDQYGARGHITSTNLLNPINTPDPWEYEALQSFARDTEMVSGVQDLEGEPHLRVMVPMWTEPGCLRCHEHQGYRVGDLRGGISISVPLAPYRAIFRSEARDAILVSVPILLLGLAFLAHGRRQSVRHVDDLTLAHETALESERQYHTLFQEAPYGIALADMETGRVQDCNTAFAQLLGRDKQDIVGCHQSSFHPDSEQDGDFSVTFTRHRGGKHGRTLTSEVVTAAGINRLVQIKAHPVEWKGRRLMQGFFQDITEEALIRRVARQREQTLRDMFTAARNVGFIIAAADETGAIMEFSPGAENIFGISREEILGQGLAVLFPDGVVPQGATVENLLTEGSKGFQGELSLVRSSLEVFTALYTLHPMTDGDGQVQAVLAVVVDINERKNLEQQLRQSQKMEAMGTLAGGIAHDFNNILGAIMGFTELSLEDVPPEMDLVRHSLDQTLVAANRAKDLVNQILVFSRHSKESREPICLGKVAQEVVAMLQHTIPATIEVEYCGDQEDYLVVADDSQLHQVILNLCTNSYQVLREEGGRITIRLGRCSERPEGLLPPGHAPDTRLVCLEVADNGPGIAPDLVGRVFDPFFTTKPVGEGTGMGLSVVHGIIRNHGGAVDLRSTLGKGTTVRVYLPLASGDCVAAGTPEGDVALGEGHVLFVDDEAMLVDLARLMLTSLGYSVTAVSSAAEALEVFTRDPDGFDLLLTDQTMSGMTGLDLARAVLDIRPGFPVIISTGYTDLIGEGAWRDAGVAALLPKPMDRARLSHELHQALAGGRGQVDELLSPTLV